MHVRLLGTAAGGGFPQWNCNCTNCRGVRSGTLQARSRTQSCVAISADNIRWFLLNASPDINQQIEAFPPLTPPAGSRRGSNIAAILLTDADLDHTLGSFILREGQQQTIYATATVRHALTEGLTLSSILNHYCGVEWREASPTWTPLCYADRSPSGLLYTSFALPDKPPRYMRGRETPSAGDRVGYHFIDERTGARLVFMPGVGALDESIMTHLHACDALLLDGTFWQENDMQIMIGSNDTASSMGHLPVGGPNGSLEVIAPLPIAHKIYTHINNTNPMLIEDSPEYALVKGTGVEIGWDGLELTL
jgi:pyrroloquinoline quinone biosynthesis protein B